VLGEEAKLRFAVRIWKICQLSRDWKVQDFCHNDKKPSQQPPRFLIFLPFFTSFRNLPGTFYWRLESVRSRKYKGFRVEQCAGFFSST
jgi:hypothetical protein